MTTDSGPDDKVLIRNSAGWWLAPGCGTTPHRDWAHKYTRSEAERALLDERAEIVPWIDTGRPHQMEAAAYLQERNQYRRERDQARAEVARLEAENTGTANRAYLRETLDERIRNLNDLMNAAFDGKLNVPPMQFNVLTSHAVERIQSLTAQLAESQAEAQRLRADMMALPFARRNADPGATLPELVKLIRCDMVEREKQIERNAEAAEVLAVLERTNWPPQNFTSMTSLLRHAKWVARIVPSPAAPAAGATTGETAKPERGRARE